ncbi:YceI family protein [Qaidamihabitans albus]|uniref:YceI family protein n=1 Tax=Qaidamihabitans albus TaxID=2795733 RepID=UPI0018F17D48|nr:YceI family protein [Qaidamihabitans albus]
MNTKRDHGTATPQLGRYEIDTSNSAVTFRSRHLFGLMPVRGTFAIRTGTVDVAEPLACSSVHVEIETASFHTGNERRDSDVRSARFLDTHRHPVLTFVAEHVDARTIAGTLTALGVTRPVDLSVEQFDVSPGAFTARATTRIDRTEFGVTAARGLAGRHLDVSLAVKCVRL